MAAPRGLRLPNVTPDAKRRRILLIQALLTISLIIAFSWFLLTRKQAKLQRDFESLLSNRQYAEASQLGARLAWYKPDDVKLILDRADIEIQLNQVAKAAQLLKSIKPDATDSISLNFRMGQLMYEIQIFDAATHHLQLTVQRDPQNLQAHRLITAILGIKRMAPEQKNALWKWYAGGVGTIESLRILAQSDVIIPPGTIQKTSDEGVILEQQLQLEPDSIPSIVALCYFYRNRGDLTRVNQLLGAALSSHPSDIQLLTEKLALLIDSGDTQSAGSLLQQLNQSIAGSPRLLELRAEYHRNAGNYASAIFDYENAIKLIEISPQLSFRLAECYRLAGRKSEYESYQKKCKLLKNLSEIAASVDINAPHPPTLIELSKIALSLNRSRESAAWAREALKLDPANAEATEIYRSQSVKQAK